MHEYYPETLITPKRRLVNVIQYFRRCTLWLQRRISTPPPPSVPACRQFQRILDDDETTPDKGEELLGALTAADRSHWYLTRRDFFSRGTNRASLLAVEKAAFVVCLDDVNMEFDPVRHLGRGRGIEAGAGVRLREEDTEASAHTVIM